MATSSTSLRGCLCIISIFIAAACGSAPPSPPPAATKTCPPEERPPSREERDRRDQTDAVDPPCAAHPLVQACGWLEPIPDHPTHFGLGASEREIALLTSSGASAKRAACVRLARYRPDLSLIVRTGCLPHKPFERTFLARTPSSWVAILKVGADDAYPMPYSAAIVELADGGTRLRQTHIIPTHPWEERTANGTTLSLFDMRLVSRPDGGPLALWTEGNTLMAAELRDDGGLAKAPFPLTGASPRVLDAVYTGDAFLILRSTGSFLQGGSFTELHLTRISTKGGPVTERLISFGDTMEVPWLTWTGEEGRLFYDTAANRKFVVTLDRGGKPTGPPVALSMPFLRSAGSPFRLGSLALMLLVNPLAPHRDDPFLLAAVGAGGGVEMPPERLSRANRGFWSETAPMGSNAVVAWAGEYRWRQYVALAVLGTKHPSTLTIPAGGEPPRGGTKESTTHEQ